MPKLPTTFDANGFGVVAAQVGFEEGQVHGKAGRVEPFKRPAAGEVVEIKNRTGLRGLVGEAAIAPME